ncbi:MAG TPA: dihydrofolate reductase family protein [Actinomycetota bacterium]|nr:dihydrofolate reductase family protein [Actinomycetota bacterium]
MSGKLLYTAICSLDGYVADEEGRFDRLAPDAEVHAFVNDLERRVGTYLYGRRMYEVMVYWETPTADSPEVELDYARVWQAADKIVYSATLADVSSTRTTLERSFDPGRVAELKASATADLSVSGPNLAAQALAAGLVEEVALLLAPVTLGGGNPVLPAGWRARLELLDDRRFGNGFAYLRYAVT